MSTAQPSDVTAIIETSLDDAAIQEYLDRAEEDNERVNDTDKMDSTQLRRIEELLASIKILGQVNRDRSVNQHSIGSASKSYEMGKIAQLRAELSKWDPSNSLGSTVIRDTDRHVTSTVE